MCVCGERLLNGLYATWVPFCLQSDVASDLESALSGPLKALSTRVNDITSVGTDAGQFAEQTKKLWAVDRMVLLAERNWHLLAQSMSEVSSV